MTKHLNDQPLLTRARTAALYAIGGFAILPALVSFGESYRGLVDWSLRHDLPGVWAYASPIMVDSFVALGELALFVAVLDRRDFWPARAQAWAVALAGLAVSVAGNVGHLAPGATRADRITAGIAPVAAAAALAVGLGILKAAAAAVSKTYKRRARSAPGAISETSNRGRWPRRRAVPDPAPVPAAAPGPDAIDRLPPPDVSHETPAASTLTIGAEAAARAYLLTLPPGDLPSARDLAGSHCGGSRRIAGRVLAAHRAGSNGKGGH